MRQIIGEIAYTIMLHRNVIQNVEQGDMPQVQPICYEFRKLASRLTALQYSIPYYDFASRRGLVPCRDQIAAAVSNLIGISNTSDWTPYELIRERITKVEDALRIRREQ